MKKRFPALLLCTLLLLSLCPEVAAAEATVQQTQQPSFSDIEDHWARETIEKYVALGVINGYEDGTFRPDALVTRAEAAKILTLTFHLEEPEEIRYTDLNGEEWEEYTDLKGTEWHYTYDIRAAQYLSLNVYAGWSTNIPLLQPYADNGYNLSGSRTMGRFLPEAHMARYHLADTVVELLAQREGIDTTVEGDSHALVEAAFPNEEHPYLGALPRSGGVSEREIRMYDRIWIAYEQGIMVGDNGCFRSHDGVTRAEFLTTIDRLLSRKLSVLPQEARTCVEAYLEAYQRGGTPESVKYMHFEDDFVRTAYIDTHNKLVDYTIEDIEKINDDLYAMTLQMKSEQSILVYGDIFRTIYNFVARIDGQWYYIGNVVHIPEKLQENLDVEKYTPRGEDIIDFDDVVH